MTTTKAHTPYCLEQQIVFKAWEVRWPHYCKECGASGFILDPGIRYYWDGTGSPPSGDTCPSCLGADPGHLPIEGEVLMCPRCGSHGIPVEDYEEGHIDCMWCGWKNGAGAEDYAPDDICLCFLGEGE